MSSLEGKTAVIFGIANHRSIAYGIAESLRERGCRILLNYQNERLGQSLKRLSSNLGDPWMAECDVTDDEAVVDFFDKVREEVGSFDYLVHSVAYANREFLQGDYMLTPWDAYAEAQHVSAYSLVRLCRHAYPLMEGHDGAVLALTYLGSEKVVKNYNLMGVAKAALESSVRYLASDLGRHGIRVNAISAGPVRTLSASAIKDLGAMLDYVAERSPMHRNVSLEDIGNAASFLLSRDARGVTGQVLHVDNGFSIMGV
ncbi:MAG: enoyl-[acyl-carrier-protein] reductase FabI [Planctomycetota bacterium]|nr:MAG: enoyl-[acyl-carrier-protein] reductase FabI [Planctomycetota bacterium]